LITGPRANRGLDRIGLRQTEEGADRAYDFFTFLLNRSLALRRYLCGSMEMSLRSSRILIPRISRPIRASQEPGVSGVSNASTPRTTNTMPKTIFRALRIFYSKKESLNIFVLIPDTSLPLRPCSGLKAALRSE